MTASPVGKPHWRDSIATKPAGHSRAQQHGHDTSPGRAATAPRSACGAPCRRAPAFGSRACVTFHCGSFRWRSSPSRCCCRMSWAATASTIFLGGAGVRQPRSDAFRFLAAVALVDHDHRQRQRAVRPCWRNSGPAAAMSPSPPPVTGQPQPRRQCSRARRRQLRKRSMIGAVATFAWVPSGSAMVSAGVADRDADPPQAVVESNAGETWWSVRTIRARLRGRWLLTSRTRKRPSWRGRIRVVGELAHDQDTSSPLTHQIRRWLPVVEIESWTVVEHRDR